MQELIDFEYDENEKIFDINGVRTVASRSSLNKKNRKVLNSNRIENTPG